jgi:hypothetical protein
LGAAGVTRTVIRMFRTGSSRPAGVCLPGAAAVRVDLLTGADR